MERVRVASTSSQADEWALVLTALAIPNTVAPDVHGWALLTPADDAARALSALDAYDNERRAERPAPTAPAPYPWMSGVALGLLLLWIYSVTGMPARDSPWFERGAAAAGRIVAGELWRALTALTLHVDVVHVTGNAVAIAVLLPPLVQRVGGGMALLLLALSGAVGNVLAALVHDPRHVAVGASTAAFGVLGALVALRLFPEDATAGRRRWTAPVAGVLLLATLGVARNADLTAHLFGFVAGVVIGCVAGLVVRRRPRPPTQWVLGTATAMAVVVSWYLA